MTAAVPNPFTDDFINPARARDGSRRFDQLIRDAAEAGESGMSMIDDPNHPDFWRPEVYLARAQARFVADRPRIEAEREQRRLSAIQEVLRHVLVIAEARRESIVAPLGGEPSITGELFSETRGQADFGFLEGKDQLGQEHLGSSAARLQFLDLLIDILGHALAPSVGVTSSNADDGAAQRQNGGGQ